MIVVNGNRVKIEGKGETIKKEMAALLYGMQNQCPELLGECVLTRRIQASQFGIIKGVNSNGSINEVRERDAA